MALLVAQKAVEQYRGTSFEKPLQSAFQKLVSSLTDEANISLHELSEAVSFHSAGVPKGQIKVFELLTEAVMASQLVEFDYLSLRASQSGAPAGCAVSSRLHQPSVVFDRRRSGPRPTPHLRSDSDQAGREV